MTDLEKLKFLDMEKRLNYSECKVLELKEEVARLKRLLSGEDVLKNSLPTRYDCDSGFNKLKSSNI
jgi:hypothetical protein